MEKSSKDYNHSSETLYEGLNIGPDELMKTWKRKSELIDRCTDANPGVKESEIVEMLETQFTKKELAYLLLSEVRIATVTEVRLKKEVVQAKIGQLFSVLEKKASEEKEEEEEEECDCLGCRAMREEESRFLDKIEKEGQKAGFFGKPGKS